MRARAPPASLSNVLHSAFFVWKLCLDYADEGHGVKERNAVSLVWVAFLPEDFPRNLWRGSLEKERLVESKASSKAFELRCLQRAGLPRARLPSRYLLTWCLRGELVASLGP